MVKQIWGRHNTVVTGTQGSEQVSKNEWNDDLNRKGLLGFDANTLASASSVTIPDDTSDDASSFIKLSGSTSVDTLVTTNTTEGDLLFVITTGTVTLNNTSSPSSAGDIRLLGNANKNLSTTVPTILMRVGNFWYEYGGQLNSSHSVSANDLTGTTLASGVVTSSITTVGTIGSGTWQGTAIADGYLGTGINATKLADGTVTSTELQYINTLSSNAQTQLDAKQATLTFGIADTNAVKINGSGSASGEYAKFTSTGIIGEEVADVKTDLSLNNVENTALSTWAGTTNVTTLGTITTGTWTGTAIADANLGTGINATKLADGSITNTELQYISTLSSNAQTQIDAKSATAGNGSLVTVGALDSGSITSGFGSINNGSSTITTTGALASGAITTSGTLTMGDNTITGIKKLDTDIDVLTEDVSGTTNIDFDDNEEETLSLTANIIFTGSNMGIGKHKTIHITSDASARTFTFPAWKFLGATPTTTVASKVSALSLTCLGSAIADVRAVFTEEA